MGKDLLKRIDRALGTARFSRSHIINTESSYAVSLTWPTYDWKRKRIVLKTSVRTSDQEGRDSKLFTGISRDETINRNPSLWEAFKSLGLRTHNNSVTVVYNSATAGQTAPKLEIMILRFGDSHEALRAAHTIKYGYC